MRVGTSPATRGSRSLCAQESGTAGKEPRRNGVRLTSCDSLTPVALPRFAPGLSLFVTSCTTSTAGVADAPQPSTQHQETGSHRSREPKPRLSHRPRRVCFEDGHGQAVRGVGVRYLASVIGPPGSLYGWESAQTTSVECENELQITNDDGCAFARSCTLKPYSAGRPSTLQVEVRTPTARHVCPAPVGDQRLRIDGETCTTVPPWVPELENDWSFKEVGLPFEPGTAFFVHQGPFGEASHSVPGVGYAWDLDVPYGTSVLSIEAGTVLEVHEPGGPGGCDSRFSESAHNVKIEHRGGTVAQYVHIEARVRSGQAIAQGEVIAVTAPNGFIW